MQRWCTFGNGENRRCIFGQTPLKAVVDRRMISQATAGNFPADEGSGSCV